MYEHTWIHGNIEIETYTSKECLREAVSALANPSNCCPNLKVLEIVDSYVDLAIIYTLEKIMRDREFSGLQIHVHFIRCKFTEEEIQIIYRDDHSIEIPKSRPFDEEVPNSARLMELKNELTMV